MRGENSELMQLSCTRGDNSKLTQLSCTRGDNSLLTQLSCTRGDNSNKSCKTILYNIANSKIMLLFLM
jgi:hypothetical protein